MDTNAAEATSNRLYEDFEPYCKWLTKEGQAVLEVNLKGFKKEELRVQTENWGILTIDGERLEDASNNKWSRFHKEIRISKGCDKKAIRAKFSHGVLYIAMPKETVMEKHFIGRKNRKAAMKVAIGMLALVALVSYLVRLLSLKKSTRLML
ncbi:hypothetical protein Fmac_015578 [Flemingia macrophylla]|uniref:SHSP domain-containing protein n=1 Tax=Flemingia macrophylla TaxID=520843 RepID=A0ABD1MEX6_9FABA